MNNEPDGGPLRGIRVLDISTVYAAPITAMLLGDYGADVIKVEHPVGDPARSHGANKDGHGLWWKVISRNKKCVTLNFGTPEGQQILRDLVLDADVLVENFRPGVLEKWGLGPEQLHALNPGLIMLRVTGFGQAGPYSRRRAFGTLAEAMSGFAHQTGHEDGPPTLPPFGLADGVAGITGAFAIMTASITAPPRRGTAKDKSSTCRCSSPCWEFWVPAPPHSTNSARSPAVMATVRRTTPPAMRTSPKTFGGWQSRPVRPPSPRGSCGWSVDPTSSRSPGLARPVSAAETAICWTRRWRNGSLPARSAR